MNTAQYWLNCANQFDLQSYGLLIVNLVLIFFARPILQRYSSGKQTEQSLKSRVMLLRGINLAIICMAVYMAFDNGKLCQGTPLDGDAPGAITSSKDDTPNTERDFAVATLSILAVLYFTYLLNYFARYFIFRTYGKLRSIGGSVTHIETYQTRALSLLASLILGVIALITCIHFMGFDDLLKAGGMIGIIGVMIGLTQAAWAPDIISGLILLHSDAFEEGDVIELPNHQVGLIYKTKMFHTEILNLTNNHRIMIRNAILRDFVLHNLSKFASAKGLRECLTFNIGYDIKPEKVRSMFRNATESAISHNIPFEHQYNTEVKLLDTGDHALTWGYIYYIKSVEQLVPIRRDIREIILNCANAQGISLATPLTHDAQIKIQPQPTHSVSTEGFHDPNAKL